MDKQLIMKEKLMLNNQDRRKEILVMGAGQLGLAVLESLLPRAQARNISVTVLVSPETLKAPSEQDLIKISHLQNLGANFVGFDLSSTEEALQTMLEGYTTVLCCTGFVAGSGTQLKITNAALKAKVPRFFPWQFGVDYDIVGRDSGQPVFDEQYEVRQLLRAQKHTEWVIVSTGMFTSFLFEPDFDVVNLDKKTIHALGSWDTKLTVTTPDDIGKLTTEILFAEPRVINQIIYVAGDTLSYGQLAEIVESVTGQKFEKKAWSVEELRSHVLTKPNSTMARYRVAFSLGNGMWWDKSQTFNHINRYGTTDVETYLRERLSLEKDV